MSKSIPQFQGHYRFLSNMWFMPKPMVRQGIAYKTVEHFFAAMKTKCVEDRRAIANCHSVHDAKARGRQVNLRSDWDEIREDVMLYALRYKFGSENPTLAESLKETGDAYLQEGNTWGDKYWGVCLKSGRGQNELGKLLMQVRRELI